MSLHEISDDEFIFIDKGDCPTCEQKEITVKFPNYTMEEIEKVMELLSKYKLTNDEVKYVYNFYNRLFNTNKTPGCGKCFINIANRIRRYYQSLEK